jgi:hypothetical protein
MRRMVFALTLSLPALWIRPMHPNDRDDST